MMMALLLLTCLVFASLGCVDTATVDKQDGGYEHVLVAIGKDVAYHGDILVNLKALFRKASAFLLAATKGKFYFKEVIISVPSSWPRMRRKKVWEDLFNQADVQVASGLKEPDTLNPSRSFPGDFNPVRLPPEFVRDLNSTTTKKFGKPEYHLIHHWANHRYGVFAEHASSPDKALYCSHNKMEATRCTEEIGFKLSDATGSVCPKNDACTDMSDLCDITFHQEKQQAPASIMFLPYLNGVSQFCDQDTHNPDALNLQNERHQGASTWDVISKHEDFLRVNRKLTVNRKIRTKFQEVQQAKKKGKRILFVLDASGSMLDYSRIQFLRYSFGHLIRHVINDDESVGIVRFNASCRVLHHLTQLSSSGARETLADMVDRLDLGAWTSIGCGLQLGIENLWEDETSLKAAASSQSFASVRSCGYADIIANHVSCILEQSCSIYHRLSEELESTGMLASGGTIILISDGEENCAPYIADQLPELVAKGVTVHTFALGSLAEQKLQDVALQTGGRAYAFGDLQKNSISSMGISFILSTTSHLEDSQKPVFLLETTVDLNSKKSVQRLPFVIPKELGRDTYVTASTTEEQAFKFYLLGPTGVKCISECTTKTLGPLMVQVKVPETKQTEKWTVVLKQKSEPVKNLSVVVMTKQRGHEDAIRAESCIRHVESTNMIVIYSRVTKGGFRVLKANVTATVTLPGEDDTVFLPLRDNGKGADVKADDGEYASYFTRYQRKGRYSVRTDVTLDPSSRLGPARPGQNPPPPGKLRAARLIRGPGKMCAASNSSPECKKASLGKAEEKRLHLHARSKESVRTGHRYDKSPLVDSRTKLIAYAGAFQLKQAGNARDLAPDRVRDLTVKNATMTSGNITVTLSWTSTGANLDTGRAKSLDLRSSLKSRDLVYKFQAATKITNDDVLEGNLTPKDPFSIHTVKVRLPVALVSASQDKPGSIFLGLRTKNKRGKKSQVSNIAPVVWPTAVKTTAVKTTPVKTTPVKTTPVKTTRRPTAPQGTYTPRTYTPEPYAEPDKGWPLATIMAVLLGLLFLGAVVIIGYYTLKRSSDDTRGDEERLAGYGDTTMGDTSFQDTTSGL